MVGAGMKGYEPPVPGQSGEQSGALTCGQDGVPTGRAGRTARKQESQNNTDCTDWIARRSNAQITRSRIQCATRGATGPVCLREAPHFSYPCNPCYSCLPWLARPSLLGYQRSPCIVVRGYCTMLHPIALPPVLLGRKIFTPRVDFKSRRRTCVAGQ